MITNYDKEKMVDLILSWFVYDADRRKPGSFIKRWCMKNEKQRKILKSLKAKDFNHRIK